MLRHYESAKLMKSIQEEAVTDFFGAHHVFVYFRHLFFLLLRRWRISEKLFWSWQQLINSELRVSWDQNRTCQRPTREVCLWLFEWPLLFFVHITWSKAQTWQNITRPHAFIASCVKSSMCNDFVLRACRMFNKGLCRLKWFSSFVHCTEMKQNKPEANTIFLFSNNRLRAVISVYINWRCQCILHNITVIVKCFNALAFAKSYVIHLSSIINVKAAIRHQ